MVYCTFLHLPALSHWLTWFILRKTGWGEVLSDNFLCLGLVSFSCFTFGRENCYHNIYNIGLMMGELKTLSEKSSTAFKMFTLPSPQHLLSFSLNPRVTPMKTSSTILASTKCRPGVYIRGGEWSLKNSGSCKILVEFHGSGSLVFYTKVSRSLDFLQG